MRRSRSSPLHAPDAWAAMRAGIAVHAAVAIADQRHGRFTLLASLLDDSVEQRRGLDPDHDLMIDTRLARYADLFGALGRVIGKRPGLRAMHIATVRRKVGH